MKNLNTHFNSTKISDFKLPYASIKKGAIINFLDLNKANYSYEEMIFLRKLTVDKWKYVAKKKIDSENWHSMNSFFNEDKYYDLFEVAEKILELKDDIDLH